MSKSFAGAVRDVERLQAALAEATARADRLAVENVELRAAGDDLAEASGALLRHFRRHTKHRCEIDRDAEAVLTRLRALGVVGEVDATTVREIGPSRRD